MIVKHYDWTSHHAEVRPDKIAIKRLDTGEQLTYKELDRRSGCLAGWLQSAGVSKGCRVALLMRNCPEFFEVQFACNKIGAIFLPLNWRLTENELAYILSNAAPSALIYDAAFTTVSEALKSRCHLADTLALDLDAKVSAYTEAIAAAHSYEPVLCNHDDVAAIMYTSGTTGHPKGAMITFAMVFFNCVNLGIPAGITVNTVQLVALPLFHTGGLNCYANPILHAGGTILLMREFDPGHALRVIGDSDEGVTHFFAVPAPYQFMMQHPEFEQTDLSRLQQAGVGGAPCAEAILRAWLDRGVALAQGWGMTETSPGGTALDAADVLRKIGSAGKPLLHTEVKIVTKEGQIVEPDEVGELYIKGPNIISGYWENPQATADSFIDGWLATGDAARVDEEGFIYIVDRWKDMYISGGENVYPAEVENVLYQLPQIAEAAVIGIPSERWGETGKAVLVLKPAEQLSTDEIINHCLKNLAKFKVPAQIEFIDALPRNATGKVLKRLLQDNHSELAVQADDKP